MLKNTSSKISNLKKAIRRLEEALKEPAKNPLAIDGTIQRFEFAFELCWKTLKFYLAQEGIEVSTPREVLQQAYISHWIDHDRLWLKMLKDRNETSHVYDEQEARAIYRRIKKYHPELKRGCEFLSARLRQK